MSVGIKILGRDVTVTTGGGALVGQVSKSLTLNNEPIDVSDENSSGWTELAAVAGKKNIEMSLSGLVKNYELLGVYFGSSQMVEVVWTLPDGSTLTLDMFLGSVSISNESDVQSTWDASLASSGAPTWVAGT